MQTPGVRAALAAGVVMIASGAGAQQPGAVQWRVEDGGNGHWYLVSQHGSDLTWAAARAIALEQGADLSSIEGEPERVWIASSLPCDAAFVGGYQHPGSPSPSSGWVWLTGADVALELICDDAPCGSGVPGENGEQDFLHSNPCWSTFGDVNGETSESGCPVPSWGRALFEWSADCNNDGIVDYGQCRDGSLPDYNCNYIPDCCETQSPCTVGRYPVQWRTSEGGNGHWYFGTRFDQAGASWTQAREDALARGGDLVSLNTLIERQWVFEHVTRNPALWTTTLGPWVGAMQLAGSQEPAGGWMWVDGTPVYEGFYWDGYHPDGNDNCGGPANRMTYWGNYTQGIGDLFADCADRIRFQCWNIDFGNHPSSVIEWSADCNSDGIVDYGQILQGHLADADANGVPDLCEAPTCTDADLTGNGIVDGADLGAVLAFWGPVGTVLPQADIDGNGEVNGADLGILLSFWGPCGG